jgi:DNA repair protein RadD
MAKGFDVRPYQVEIVDRARAAIRSHKAILIQAATGSGKTAMATMITASAVLKRRRVWFVCHRDFLLDQTSGAFDRANIFHGFLAAGQPFNPYIDVQIVSVDTLKRRLAKPLYVPPDIMIWDECHHIGAEGWKNIRQWAGDCIHIGFSATPARLDGRPLKDSFEVMISGPTPAWLIDNGFLSDYRAYAPTKMDMTGVKKLAGEYSAHDQERVLDTGEMIGEMVRHYAEKAGGMRGVYFAPSINLSRKWAAEFSASGIPSIHLDGTSSREERRAGALAMARGEILVIFNVALFGEGYDLAAQAGMDVTIDMVGVCRRTTSLSLHYQMLGRALRPAPGKTAVFLDHVGNIEELGLPDQEVEWSLEGRVKRASAGGDGLAEPAWTCPKCKVVNNLTLSHCVNCGEPRPIAEGAVIKEVEGELQEVDKAAARLSRKMEEWECHTLADLVALATRREYKNPEKWAAHVWTAREARNAKGNTKAQHQFEYYNGGSR